MTEDATDEFRALVRVRLTKEPFHVVADGALGNSEVLRDLRGREATDEKLEYGNLALGHVEAGNGDLERIASVGVFDKDAVAVAVLAGKRDDSQHPVSRQRFECGFHGRPYALEQPLEHRSALAEELPATEAGGAQDYRATTINDEERRRAPAPREIDGTPRGVNVRGSLPRWFVQIINAGYRADGVLTHPRRF
jgi:hypothetical protein